MIWLRQQKREQRAAKKTKKPAVSFFPLEQKTESSSKNDLFICTSLGLKTSNL